MVKFDLILKPLLAAGLLLAAGGAGANNVEEQLLGLQRDWAQVNYELEGDAQEEAFEELEARAAELVAQDPDNPDVLIWEGIVLSSYAGAKGGLGALGLAKHSRADLEKALELNEAALEGSAHTSLGVLYYKVPGWPFGFGSDDKARKHLQRALEINPDGIDPNYFYGEFLYEQHQYPEALRYVEKALVAPDRPSRPLADSGRRREAEALKNRIRGELED